MSKLDPGKDKIVGQLQETHSEHEANKNEWRFLMSAYEGTRKLVANGYLYRNERESIKNWERRCKEAAGFDYSKSIVDLFNFYLFKKPVKRDMGPLKSDQQWQMFMADCNLYGDSFDDFLTEQGRYASTLGHVGILVDFPSKSFDTKKEELDAEVYPYLAAYFPNMILDWEFERDENNRPFLAYLKLLDDDGQYRLWWPDKWEIWEFPEDAGTLPPTAPKNAQSLKDVKANLKAKLVDDGDYDLGEIPFVWLENIKTKTRPIGMSDIHEVARLDVSILRNLSQGEEIISFTAFPMMIKPMREIQPDGNPAVVQEDIVGEQAILEFNPEHPESKPSWLQSEAREPIDAILDWVARKIEEIYRVVNAGGMASTEISKEAKSGTALKAEFQLLNASLVRKAKNLEKAEHQIVYYWLGWEKKPEVLEKVSIQRERSYDVDDLASDLENALTSSIIVKSKKFNEEIQKQIVRQMLPAAENEVIKEIDDQIEEAVEFEPLPEEGDFDDEGQEDRDIQEG